MENRDKEKQQLQKLLEEAIDLLHDERHRFGLFQTQRYWRLRHSVERSGLIELTDVCSAKSKTNHANVS
jgi:hypothetical protein